MSHSRQHLIEQFESRDYREGYDDTFSDSWIASQINVIRKDRGLTQAQLGEMVGIKQAGISRIENVNYGRWNVGTLRRIAHALGTRLKVSLEAYGSLVEEAVGFSMEALKRPSFEDDPVFRKRRRLEDLRPAGWEVEGPVGWMRQMLLPWLESPGSQATDLVKWLQGRGLPGVGDHDEPYRWFLRALPEEPAWAEHRKELAGRVARVLWSEPDRDPPGPRPGEFLTNLFLLAAGLDYPDVLAAPLYPVYDRLRSEKTKPGEDQRDCLVAALTRNQADFRLCEVWMRMVESGRDPILGGSELAGFAGLKWLPPRPNVPAMGQGVKALERHFRPEVQFEIFSELLGGVLSAYPQEVELADSLLGQAFELKWSDWPLAAWARVFGSRVQRASLGDEKLARWVVRASYAHSMRHEAMTFAGADPEEIEKGDAEHRKVLSGVVVAA